MVTTLMSGLTMLIAHFVSSWWFGISSFPAKLLKNSKEMNNIERADE